MKILSNTLKVLTCATFILTLSSLAQAATRTWVSGVGDDVNPCSRTAPCKTYAGAISKTAKDGEISTLDPGGFGAITITKSITINGGGQGQGYGSILAALTNGVIVNITDVNDIRKTVRLNWLDINGASTGLDGIRFIAGLELHVENTTIDGFTGDGIEMNISASGQITNFSMRNVTIRNCGGSGVKTIATGAGANVVSYDNINVTRCATGIDAQNGTRGGMRASMIAMNTTGIATSEGTSGTEMNIDGTTILGNTTGISVGGSTSAPTASVRLARCLITQNVTSMTITAPSTVDTGGNNTIMGNTNNNAPNGTVFPQN
jgi:hypothetical protein